MKVAINGFGRIGRAAAKIILNRSDMELVAINDLGDLAMLSHLLKYDSSYGVYEKMVGYDNNDLLIEDKRIRFYSEKEPNSLPWRELGVDVVIESTGKFLTAEKVQPHLDAGARKIVMSAPAKDDTPTYVIGVNSDEYKGEAIVSNASCTTNCIAPIMKILNDFIGIEKSLMTTVHSYTADQNLIDGPHHGDLRRARAAACNIVPTSTGAAKACHKAVPSLKDSFDGIALRVPTPVVSLSDISVVFKRDTSAEEINHIFAEASEGKYETIIAVTDEPIVSSDLIKTTVSATVDLPLTQVIGGNLGKIIAWYDNEWGYSCRLVDLAAHICN